jgi:hypothetical protein
VIVAAKGLLVPLDQPGFVPSHLVYESKILATRLKPAPGSSKSIARTITSTTRNLVPPNSAEARRAENEARWEKDYENIGVGRVKAAITVQ